MGQSNIKYSEVVVLDSDYFLEGILRIKCRGVDGLLYYYVNKTDKWFKSVMDSKGCARMIGVKGLDIVYVSDVPTHHIIAKVITVFEYTYKDDIVVELTFEKQNMNDKFLILDDHVYDDVDYGEYYVIEYKYYRGHKYEVTKLIKYDHVQQNINDQYTTTLNVNYFDSD